MRTVIGFAKMQLCGGRKMVRGEYAWVVCVCISYPGDEGQLGSSFLWNGRRGLGWAGHLSKKLAVKWEMKSRIGVTFKVV